MGVPKSFILMVFSMIKTIFFWGYLHVRKPPYGTPGVLAPKTMVKRWSWEVHGFLGKIRLEPVLSTPMAFNTKVVWLGWGYHHSRSPPFSAYTNHPILVVLSIRNFDHSQIFHSLFPATGCLNFCLLTHDGLLRHHLTADRTWKHRGPQMSTLKTDHIL